MYSLGFGFGGMKTSRNALLFDFEAKIALFP